MLRALPWILIGGVALIVGVIIFQVAGTYWFLNSPERVVNAAVAKILNAKSFDFELTAVNAAPGGGSLALRGAWGQELLLQPKADLEFDFQAPDQRFYGKGEISAQDGSLYAKFDQVAGIPNMLPGALSSIWTGADYPTILNLIKSKIVPDSSGTLTEEDMKAIRAIALKHSAIKPDGKGTPTALDGEPVMRYAVHLDRGELGNFAIELKAALMGGSLPEGSSEEIRKWAASLPSVAGEIWVSRRGGELRAAYASVKSGEADVRASARVSSYDRPVVTRVPLDARPLIELWTRLFGASLSGAASLRLNLPFDLNEAASYDWKKLDPNQMEKGNTKDKAYGPGIDWLKLFYGTNNLFEKK